MKGENLLELIKKRRSIREFKGQEAPKIIIENSLEAARWAPSGLNNQPWRFMVLSRREKDSLAQYTKYSSVIKKANKLILFFFAKKSSYNYEKDLMAVGAAIQNTLLYLHAEGLGACWLGEILNKRREVEQKLKVASHFQLAAVVAAGIPLNTPSSRERIPLKNLILP